MNITNNFTVVWSEKHFNWLCGYETVHDQNRDHLQIDMASNWVVSVCLFFIYIF